MAAESNAGLLAIRRDSGAWSLGPFVGSSPVRSWNLREIEVKGGSRSPVVLDSDEAARAVLIVLEPGQSLGDHQVKEHAFLLVVDGAVQVESHGETLTAGPG